jgi:hypothetical protein
MVVETHGGGWGKAAREVLDGIAKNLAVVWNDNKEVAGFAIAHRLSVTLSSFER